MGLSLGTDFDDPRTQGLLQLGLGLLGSRGSFAQSLSSAGQQGLLGYQQAAAQKAQREQQNLQRQMQEMQVRQAQEAEQQRQQIRAAQQRRMQSPEQAAMSAAAGAGGQAGPTNAAAALVPKMGAGGFDMAGYQNDLMGIDFDRGMALRQMLQKDETPVALAEGGMLVTKSGRQLAANPKQPDLPSSVREFQYGQQNPGFNPWMTGMKQAGATRVRVDAGQRFENAYSSAQGKSFSDAMENITRAGYNAPQQIRKLERMTQLLDGVDGGRLAPLGAEVASMANSMGLKIDPKLGNKEAAQALSREIAGGFRQPGTGQMTDKDFDNFLLQVPDLSKSAEGRAAITKTMRAALNRDMALASKARDYERRNGKLDGGFMEEAAQFIAQNPVVGDIAGWQGQDLGDGFVVRRK